MIIVTNKLDVIIAMAEEIKYQANGYPVIDGVAYPPEITNLFSVESIPSDIEPEKYCYTSELGFYENFNYFEPNEYGLPNEMYEEIISKGYEQALLDLMELEMDGEE